jgi:hypothetical protein
MKRFAWAVAAALSFVPFAAVPLAALTGCSIEHAAIDAAMATAYRPPPFAEPPPSQRGRYELLAGDLHTHVMPPDHPAHVSRTLAQTAELAESEHLDFVVLTPHVHARFFQDATLRAQTAARHAELRRAIASLPRGGPLFVAGMEYTDGAYGHAGVAFADLDAVLAEVSLDVAVAHPERFFESWIAHGGLVVVNHPLVTPIAGASFSIAREDLSWRPLQGGGPFPPEIAAIDRLAQGFEIYNLTATELRDPYLLGKREYTLRQTIRRLDDEILRRRRRLTPVGGSDSHSHHLRATTFVLSEGRSERAIRDAIANGRTCVRSQSACSIEARSAAANGEWTGVGGTIARAEAVLVRAEGDAIQIVRNGAVVARPRSGEVVRVGVEAGRCSVLRAQVDEGFSAPIYVNCDF